MIEKVKNIIMNADYKKTARFFVIFSLIAFLVGGAVSALSLKHRSGKLFPITRPMKTNMKNRKLKIVKKFTRPAKNMIRNIFLNLPTSQSRQCLRKSA